MDAEKYEVYKESREIEEGFKTLKESYIFKEDENVVTPDENDQLANQDNVNQDNDMSFIDQNYQESGTMSEIRKLVFKALGEVQDDITSPEYQTLKKIWNLLDGIACQKDNSK